MASILCPKCSKRVEFSDDGKCPNCGYINITTGEVSPFTPSAEEPHVSYDDDDDQCFHGGSRIHDTIRNKTDPDGICPGFGTPSRNRTSN